MTVISNGSFLCQHAMCLHHSLLFNSSPQAVSAISSSSGTIFLCHAIADQWNFYVVPQYSNEKRNWRRKIKSHDNGFHLLKFQSYALPSIWFIPNNEICCSLPTQLCIFMPRKISKTFPTYGWYQTLTQWYGVARQMTAWGHSNK